MTKVVVYRFSLYDVQSDVMVRSRRWGTKEAIAFIGGQIHVETAVETDECNVKSDDVPGLTVRDFDPHAIVGFQKLVDR